MSTVYTYDDLGLIAQETEGTGITRAYTYDNQGRLYQVKDNGTVIATYAYDANGNRSSLSYADGVTATATYTHRPDGLRDTKAVNGVSTTQVWDGSNLAMERTDSAATGKHLRGVGLIAADLGARGATICITPTGM